MERQYWAYVKTGRQYINVGPFETREHAIEEGWKNAPFGAKSISTGYGSRGADFDIRAHYSYQHT